MNTLNKIYQIDKKLESKEQRKLDKRIAKINKNIEELDSISVSYYGFAQVCRAKSIPDHKNK